MQGIIAHKNRTPPLSTVFYFFIAKNLLTCYVNHNISSLRRGVFLLATVNMHQSISEAAEDEPHKVEQEKNLCIFCHYVSTTIHADAGVFSIFPVETLNYYTLVEWDDSEKWISHTF